MSFSKEIKHIFFVAATAFSVSSCYAIPEKSAQTPIVSEAPPRKDPIQEALEKTYQEVINLSQTYPEDSLVNKVYLGNLNSISPIFTTPLRIGIIDPNVAYTRAGFTNPQYSPNPRFRYTLYSDSSVADYQTLQSMDITIYFSPRWLNSKNDEVKKLALEKEAYSLALWEPFSRIILNTYLSQGRIGLIDPEATEAEIAHTLTRQLLLENQDVRKLYDYAGYLAVLPQVGNLLDMGSQDINEELQYSNLPQIYTLAKLEGVEFEDSNFGSREFLQLAFDINGPWAQMILDPSIPGPVLVH